MVRYAVAILMGWLAAYVSSDATIMNSNFLVRFIGFILSSIAAFYGFRIGEKFRDAIIPDFVLTDGRVSSLVKVRVFWAIGLQLAGAFIATILVSLLFFRTFGPDDADIRAMKKAQEQAALEKWEEDHPEEAARKAREKAEEEELAKAESLRAKSAQEREMKISSVSSLTSQFAQMNHECESGKSQSAARTEWDALNQRDVLIPASANPYQESCVKSESLMSEIQGAGVCRGGTTNEFGSIDWILCSEVKK